MALNRTPTVALDWTEYPESDGEPMAETLLNQITMINGQFAARYLLERQGRTNVAVGGNQLIYYTEGNRRDHISTDIYIALDVPPGLRPTWMTWVERKFPDIVFEISSPSTQDVDVGRKVRLYERLGAQEYYVFDPQLAMQPVLRAYHRQGQQLAEVALSAGPGMRVFSPLLRTELVVVGNDLRIINPQTGKPLIVPDELQAAYNEATERLMQETAARREAEQRAANEAAARHVAEQARRDAEVRVISEATARREAEQAQREAEERAASEATARREAEAALHAALAELARRSAASDATEQ